MKIYVDLDGTITDFDRALYDLTGVWLDRLPNTYASNNNETDLLLKQVPTKGGVDFWANMNWLPEGKLMWSQIKALSNEHNCELSIISSPGTVRGSDFVKVATKGKPLWVKKELGDIPLILECEKEKYADKNSILIDDYTKNIDKWTEKGGIGILHKIAFQTISELTNILKYK